MLEEVVAGAQRGVDEAALDVAEMYRIKVGGWCPKGRINEAGSIPKKYSHLKEVSGIFKKEQDNYDLRTRKNIEDSDGTLVLVPKIPLPAHIKDGTLLTIKEAIKQRKPFLMIDLSEPNEENAEKVVLWLRENLIKRLNIGGPRESSSEGIYELSFNFLKETLKHLYPRPRF